CQPCSPACCKKYPWCAHGELVEFPEGGEGEAREEGGECGYLLFFNFLQTDSQDSRGRVLPATAFTMSLLCTAILLWLLALTCLFLIPTQAQGSTFCRTQTPPIHRKPAEARLPEHADIPHRGADPLA
ncbi:hypothetical protein HPG69_018067, partial [Diceros bicornis minor]